MRKLITDLILIIAFLFLLCTLIYRAFDLADMIPSQQNYQDSLRMVIKANERTIWLLRNDSITHVRCFRIND